MPCRINLHRVTGYLEFLEASLRWLRMVKSSGQLKVVLMDWDGTNPRFSTRKKKNVSIIGTGILRFIIITLITRFILEAN